MSEIYYKILSLKDYLGSHDPHSILFPLAANMTSKTFEEQYGSISGPILEYVMNLISCMDQKRSEELPCGDAEFVENLATEIFGLCIAQERRKLGEETPDSDKLEVVMKLRRLLHRNDRHFKFVLEETRALFTTVEDELFFRKHQFSANDAILFFENSLKRIETQIAEIKENGVTEDNVNVFEIKSLNDHQTLLEKLSFEIGTDQTFKKGYPLGTSLVGRRPILKLEGRYYAYHPYLLMNQMWTILKGWLESATTDKEFERWKERRSEYLENETAACLRKIFPETSVTQSLYYEFDNNTGRAQTFENDCCVVFDETIIAFAQKSGSTEYSQKVKRTAGTLIRDGFEQSDRLLKFVRETSEAQFHDKSGQPLLTIEGHKLKHFVPANVTLEHTGFTLGVSSLETLEVIDGWGWTISLSELRIITSCLETPSQFILYLGKRRALYGTSLSDSDELELFGAFLGCKLEFKGLLNESDHVTLLGHALEIEHAIDGKTDFPKFPSTPFFEKLVNEIDQLDYPGRTSVSLFLLMLNEQNQKLIENRLFLALESFEIDGLYHDLTIVYGDVGFSFTVGSDFPTSEFANYQLVHKRNVARWIQINFKPSLDLDSDTPLRVTHRPSQFSDELMEEVALDSLQRARLATNNTLDKIGAYQTCPCQSGIKFKWCCFKTLRDQRRK